MGQRRWLTGAMVLSALSLLVAACGGDDSPDETAGQTTPPADTSPGEATEWEPGGSWDAGAPAEWADILAAGQEEGVVVVGGPPFLEEPMREAFERDTGITLEWLGAGGGDISARLEQEARSGNLSLDLILGGGTELETLYQDDLLTNVKEQLILPGVQDGDHWRLGARQWYDDAGAYLFEGSGYVFGFVVVNADLVDPASITTWSDLLKPEFTGQIIAFDPAAQGPGQGAATAMVGGGMSVDFLEDLLIGQEVEFTEDNTQVVEALARETHSVALFALQSEVEQFKEEGFNLEVVLPEDFPGYVSSGFSVVKQAVGAPHPNAAQVFINWYASLPGAQVYQDTMLEASNRLDTDNSALPEYVIPQEGVEYFTDSTEDYRLNVRREAADDIIEMLGGR